METEIQDAPCLLCRLLQACHLGSGLLGCLAEDWPEAYRCKCQQLFSHRVMTACASMQAAARHQQGGPVPGLLGGPAQGRAAQELPAAGAGAHLLRPGHPGGGHPEDQPAQPPERHRPDRAQGAALFVSFHAFSWASTTHFLGPKCERPDWGSHIPYFKHPGIRRVSLILYPCKSIGSEHWVSGCARTWSRCTAAQRSLRNCPLCE